MHKKLIYPLLFAMLTCLPSLYQPARAQSKQEIKKAYQLFGGPWVNKKTTRHLRIFIEGERDGYFTINDWTSKFQKRENCDAYKAFIKSGKLVMLEDTEHHSDYSELQLQNHQLIYITKFKDVTGKVIIEREVFVREPW